MVEESAKVCSMEPTIRPLGSTELTLCKGLASGTGITVIGLLFSKHHAAAVIQNILRHLQSAHLLLRSRIRYDAVTKTFSFVTMPAPFIEVEELNAEVTSTVLQPDSPSSAFVQIVEHELSQDMWTKFHSPSKADVDVFSARIYELENGMRVLALQFLTAVLDRTAGASLLKEFLARLSTRDETDPTPTLNTKVGLPIEDLSPMKIAKGIWSTGRNLLSGAMISIGLTNLSFKDTKSSPRSSRFIRMELDQLQTRNLLSGCESRGIKLHAALAAAGVKAAFSSNASRNDDTFGVITVFDCRPSLNPPLTSNDMGFYSTGLITSLPVCKTESFWKLAEKADSAFTKAKKTNKHFTDMVIGNFLYCKAIENPGLTPSSAQRTSLLSVFEEPVIMTKDVSADELGLEDFISCSSAHGAGPSITIVDTLLDGELQCIFTYPTPLHSRDQVAGLVDKMKDMLVDAGQH